MHGPVPLTPENLFVVKRRQLENVLGTLVLDLLTLESSHA